MEDAYCRSSSAAVVWTGGGLSACWLYSLTPSLCASALILAALRLRKSAKAPAGTVCGSKTFLLEASICALLSALHLTHTFTLVAIHSPPPPSTHVYDWVMFFCWGGLCFLWLHDHRLNVKHSLCGYVMVGVAATAHALGLASWRNKEHYDFDTRAGRFSFSVLCAGLTLSLCALTVAFVRDRRLISKARQGYVKVGDEDKKKEPVDGWSRNWAMIRQMTPYLWPHTPTHQLCALGSLLLLTLGRVVAVCVPLAQKRLVNELTEAAAQHTLKVPFATIITYGVLQALHGSGGSGAGLLATVRGLLYVPVTQHTESAIKVKLFDHIHSLSLQWHLNRKTGEVLRSMDRGTDSVANVTSLVLFNVLPAIADIIIAVIYFVLGYDALFGSIALLTMVAYVAATVGLTEWCTRKRKDMNKKDKAMRGIAVDSLLNFETVKYFSAETHERTRYLSAMDEFQSQELNVQMSYGLQSTVQTLITSTGMVVGVLLCGYRVALGQLSVGGLVQFITYMAQLYGPLATFGSTWRQIQNNLTDMENMLELLDISPDVIDAPQAKELAVTAAPEVSFQHVTFGYGDRLILNDISFTIPPGQTYALVGTSGGGKSTILRLLFRFYDIQSGCISINGQDISLATQASLRRAIGVVPQDTVLFHESVEYNLRYGRPTAGREEVEAASVAAEMHQRILSFRDGYDTVVGERGLRLSGGGEATGGNSTHHSQGPTHSPIG